MNSIILCIIIVILFAISLTSSKTVNSSDFYYNHNGRVKKLNINWMSTISDSVHLNHLSLPGTHDTMALYGGPFAQTQSLSLDSQLKAGIRAFDIRCRHIHDTFEIHHGPISQKTDMDKVMTSMISFLQQFPKEVLLVRIKEEHVPKENGRSFEETMNHYFNKPSFSSFIWRGNSTVSLGNVRGKIVIFRNYPSNHLIGIPWDNTVIQDDYIIPTIFAIKNKWFKIVKHLERAQSLAYRSESFIVNFLSGTSIGAYPSSIAKRINKYITKWLTVSRVDFIGIIYMDFPGEGLINSIIRLNSGIRITNGLEESGKRLEFICNHDKVRHFLKPTESYQYKNKLNGLNVCKFWVDQRKVTLVLKTGNENILVNEVGFYRFHDGFHDGFYDKHELGRWTNPIHS